MTADAVVSVVAVAAAVAVETSGVDDALLAVAVSVGMALWLTVLALEQTEAHLLWVHPTGLI